MANILADLFYTVIDPRVRSSEEDRMSSVILETGGTAATMRRNFWRASGG